MLLTISHSFLEKYSPPFLNEKGPPSLSRHWVEGVAKQKACFPPGKGKMVLLKSA